MGGGAIIAAAAAAHRKGLEKVLDAYRMASATSIDRAQSLSAMGLEPNNWVDELRESGILKPGMAPDTWFLDEMARVVRRDAASDRRRFIVRIVIGLLVVAAIVGLIPILVLRMNGGAM